MASEVPRSPEARVRAEQALATVARAVHGQAVFFVVLGGLVPEVLTARPDSAVPKHLGTADVDILVAFHVDGGRGAVLLERALLGSGFAPDAKQAGWRWTGQVQNVPVKLEFLCDLDDEPAESVWPLPGCRRLTALNLRGTGYVAEDWAWHELPQEDGTAVRVRFAGLEGYLMSKVHAARDRGLERDYYDLVYTLLYNHLREPGAGLEGPTAAGEALAHGRFGQRIDLQSSAWRELAARFATPNDLGPRGYAAEAHRADPESNLALDANDAVAAIAEFLDAIREGHGDTRTRAPP